MSIEEGFIQYNLEVKGADAARRKFDELSDAAMSTGKGFDALDRHVRETEKSFPRLGARLRDSVAELRKYDAALKASDSTNAAKSIDERRANYLRERQEIEALGAQLKETQRIRALDKSYRDAVERNAPAAKQTDERGRAEEIGRTAAAQERLNKAYADSATTKARVAAVGDPTGTGDASRVREAVAAQDAMGKATREVTAAQRNMASAQSEATEGIVSQRYAMYDMSNALMIVGGALAGIGIYSVVTAAKFETSFTAVERTLDNGVARDAIDGLRNSLVNLSGEVPLAFDELTKIATIGNQMNLGTDQVAEFTGTIARFASLSQMSVDQVASAFGRVQNLSGLDPKYFENLGSSIVAVGLESAATEEQILSILTQITSLTTASGFAIGETVGLAGALATLGIAPENARGSLDLYSKALTRALATGGAEMEAFAQITGLTSEELNKLVRSGEGAEVFNKFLEGMSNADDIVETQVALDSIGLTASRVSTSIGKLARDTSILTSQQNTAMQAFLQGSELQSRYASTLDDLNSQWIIFINGINGLIDAISGGAVPGLASLLSLVNRVTFGLIEMLQKYPWAGYILGFGVALVAVTGFMLLFRAGVMRAQASLLAYQFYVSQAGRSTVGAAGSVRGLTGAMLGLGASAGRAASGMVLLRSALLRTGIGALVIGGGFLVEKLLDMGSGAKDAAISLDEYNSMTRDAGSASGDTSEDVGGLGESLGDTGSAAQETAKKLRLLTDYAQDLQGVLARSFSIRFDSASAIDSVTSKWIKIREEAEKYQQEINKLTADRSLREYWLSIAELYDDQLRASQLRSEIADIDADLAKANAGASRELVGNTSAAIDNRSTMRELVKGYEDYIKALAESGASQQFIQEEIRRLNGDFMDQATALGYNAGEVSAYSIAFSDMATVVSGVPRNVDMEFNGDPALQALAEFAAKAAEDARSAGSGANDAFNDGFGGGGGLPDPGWDDLTESAGEAGKKAGSEWAKRFTAGNQAAGLTIALDGVNKGNPLGAYSDLMDLGKLGVTAKADAYTSGSEIMVAFNEGMRQVADPQGVIRAKIALGQELTQGELYTLARNGASGFNEEILAVADPTGKIREKILNGSALTVAETQLLAASVGTNFDATILDTVDPVHNILVKIGSGKELLNAEAATLAEENGYYYNAAIAGASDPISEILAKIADGKTITNDEATLLSETNAASYNLGIASNVDVSTPITSALSATDAMNAAAKTSGEGVGWNLWQGVKDGLSGFAKWIADLFTVKVKGPDGEEVVVQGFGGTYQSGGYTGPGGVSSVAGVVHGQEYVIPAHGVDQRTKLPKPEYVDSLRRGGRAPSKSSSAGYQSGGFVNGSAGSMELGEYTLNRIARQVAVSLNIDGQQLASAASAGDARLAQRGSN